MDEQEIWPYRGRDAPLAAVQDAVATGAGAVVVGAAGTGKTRLVAEALAGLDRFATVRAIGTPAGTGIPFGAFAHVLGDLPAGGNLLRAAAGQLRAAAGQLRTAAGAGPLLLVIDDAHWLDAASATLLHHLARHADTRVLVTLRAGEPAPQPVVALWKDELMPRVELAPLPVAAVAEVLGAALAGPVEDRSARHLARVSGGNLLYLRELVRAGRATGALAAADGSWCWRGNLPVTAQLRDLVEDRIGLLDPEQADVLELVSFGEPVSATVLTRLTSVDAVERAEQRGLVVTAPAERRWQVRLAHPLYGEVVRERCGAMRTRRRLRQLAEAVAATGLRRREDLLQVAVWRLDSGSAAGPRLLLAAARQAWARHDTPLAARLARAAVAAGGGDEATAVLAGVLLRLGRVDEAGRVLRLDARTSDPGTLVSGPDRARAQYAISCGFSLAAGGAPDAAGQLLDSAAARIADPAWRQDVVIGRGMVDFLAGRPADAQLALAPPPLTRRAAANAAALSAWLDAYAGRTDQALATAAAALADTAHCTEQAPYAQPTLLAARCVAYVLAGDLDGAQQAADAGPAWHTTPGDGDILAAYTGSLRALATRLRGDAAGALRWCQDGSRDQPSHPYLLACLGELAHAAALTGATQTARQALAQAESLLGALAGGWAITRLPVLLARAWVAAAGGDLDAAVREAVAAADAAEKHELTGFAVLALHDAVRLGSAGLAADRLAALARTVDGPLVRVCAQHAQAAVARDGRRLAEASQTFEDLGMLLYAAEAAAHAAGAFAREGRQASARAARTRAWTLARQCPAVHTPALVELAAPELTPRQREIAQLAAAGLTNRQIAQRLTLSVRTAANHLQAVYDKLGVSDRAEAGRILRHLPS